MNTAFVGHIKNFRSQDFPKYPSDYTLVASVEVPPGATPHQTLDYCFEKTNSIDRVWWENAGVTLLVKGGARSTSVGDVVVLPEGKVYCCAPIGWEEINVK